MAYYSNILLAVDFSEFTDQASNTAAEVVTKLGGELNLLHVVEPLPLRDPGYGVILPIDVDFTEQMVEVAQGRLGTIGEKLGVPKERQWVEVGSPKAEIVRFAAEKHVDLILIGTHGRHGIAVLLGSTASSVVNHAGCDVLTIRLKDR